MLSGTLQDVVPPAVTEVELVCQPFPLQCRPSLERRIVARTRATPECGSAALPQSRELGEHPADHVVAL